jgi:hypothetical protein
MNTAIDLWRSEGMAEMDDQTGMRLARVESDIKHIQTDVADIKIELRRTGDRIDKLDSKVEAVNNSLTSKIDALAVRLDDKIDRLSVKLTTAYVWAFGLYIGLAGGLLFILAKGFKWI